MPGMRMGADRIVKCIMGIFNGYGLPEVMPWVSIAEQLGGDRGRIIEAEPLRFEAAQEMHLLVRDRIPTARSTQMPWIPHCAGSRIQDNSWS